MTKYYYNLLLHLFMEHLTNEGIEDLQIYMVDHMSERSKMFSFGHHGFEYLMVKSVFHYVEKQ